MRNLFIWLLLLSSFAFADSTTTLTNRTDGETIGQAFFNDIHAALDGDFVGRNSSGVPTSGQNLGTSTYRWAIFGTTGNFSGTVTLPSGSISSSAWSYGSSTFGGSGIATFTGAVVHKLGTVGAPAWYFTGYPTTGPYMAADDRISWALAGAQGINWLYSTYNFYGATAGTTATLAINNTNNSNTASHAQINIISGGASGGDARIYWSNSVVGPEFFMGIANADSDKFVFARDGSSLGSNKVFEVDSTKAFTVVSQLIGKGTVAADDAASGYIGETLTAFSGTTNFSASNTWIDGPNKSLPAGDYEVTVIVLYTNNGATATDAALGISTVSGNTSPGTAGREFIPAAWPASALADGSQVFTNRVSLSATTTVYGKVKATYSAGTPQWQGRITAIRIR